MTVVFAVVVGMATKSGKYGDIHRLANAFTYVRAGVRRRIRTLIVIATISVCILVVDLTTATELIVTVMWILFMITTVALVLTRSVNSTTCKRTNTHSGQGNCWSFLVVINAYGNYPVMDALSRSLGRIIQMQINEWTDW